MEYFFSTASALEDEAKGSSVTAAHPYPEIPKVPPPPGMKTNNSDAKQIQSSQ